MIGVSEKLIGNNEFDQASDILDLVAYSGYCTSRCKYLQSRISYDKGKYNESLKQCSEVTSLLSFFLSVFSMKLDNNLRDAPHFILNLKHVSAKVYLD